MFKKNTITTLLLLALFTSVSVIMIGESIQEDSQISPPSLNAVLRPVFKGADENTTLIVSRNNGLHRGAVIQADPYANVTIWYSYQGGDNETAPRLYGDDGNGILDWETETLMQYDEARTVIKSDGSGYYNYTFNMTSSFVSFYARYGEFEDDLKTPNIITTNVRIESSILSTSVTQLEELFVNVTMHNYNITHYGFQYRKVTLDYSNEYENITYAHDFPNEERVVTTRSGNISHSFVAGTEVEVRAFILYNDNMVNSSRYLIENQPHFKVISDATPTLELSSEPYTNQLSVDLDWEASALRYNITYVEIDWDDLTANQTFTNTTNEGDLNTYTVEHNYTVTGEYNITVTASCEFLNTTEYVVVLIEQIDPVSSVMIKLQNGTYIVPPPTPIDVVSETKAVTFLLTGSDSGGSGIEKIAISSDEGNLVEIAEDGEAVLDFLTDGIHVITITVVDKAGNSVSDSFTINLVIREVDTGDIPVPFPFGIAVFAGLISLAILYIRRKK